MPHEGAPLILERDARLARLDEAIAKGIEAANAGDIKPFSEVFARLEAKIGRLPIGALKCRRAPDDDLPTIEIV